MIAGVFHQGSGLGNQLHRYTATRCLALEKGYDFGMIYPENFKGTFMKLDMGVPVENLAHEFNETKVFKDGHDVRPYDLRIKEVEDFTLIDGEFQDQRYFTTLDKSWFEVEPLDLPDDLCIINFRGGEYVGVSDLFLPKSYWDKAIAMMPGMRFEVHTDDPHTARQFFPYPIIHDISLNWRSIRYAKNLIISNSSFAILPALMSGARVLAPKFWAGYNKGLWQLPQNEYPQFTYL